MLSQVEIIQRYHRLTTDKNWQNRVSVSEHLLACGQTETEIADHQDKVGLLQPAHPPPESSTDMHRHQELPPDGVYFDGARGHCYVCSIELTSLQHKNQHIDGKQHKKRAMTFAGAHGSFAPAAAASGAGGGLGAGLAEGLSNEMMMCSICSVPLSGPRNVQEHFSSAKHKAKKEEFERKPNLPIGANPFSQASSGRIPEQVSSLFPFPGKPATAQPELGSFGGLHGHVSLPERHVTFPVFPRPNRPQLNNASAAGRGSLHIYNNSLESSASSYSSESGTYGSGSSPSSPEGLKIEWVVGRNQGLCHMCDEVFQTLDDFNRHMQLAQSRHEDFSKPGCSICQVQYSGSASAKQHLNSAGHKKKQLMGELASGRSETAVDTGPSLSPFRNLLQYSLTSSELSHRMSDVQELEETTKKLGISSDNSLGAGLHASSSGYEPWFGPFAARPNLRESEHKTLNALDASPGFTTPLTHFNILPSLSNLETATRVPLVPSASSHTAAQDAEYIFDGNRGKCNVCGIEFTSRPHADSHLAGAKHQKAKLRWQPKMSTPLNSGLTAVLANTLSGSAVGHAGAVLQTERAEPEQAVLQLNKVISFDGAKGFCFACRVDLTSEAHANQHLSGRKHQAAAERWVLEGEARNYPLYCDICYKPFTGQESAAQHFSSEKHKKKVTLSQGAMEGKKDPETGALLILKDGQMWYMCEVCKCPLNTPQQFRLHVQSPRHNSEVQKSQQQNHSSRPLPADGGGAGNMTTAGFVPPDPADLQHLVTRSSTLKTTAGTYCPQLPPMPLNLMKPGMALLSGQTDLATQHSTGPSHQFSSTRSEAGCSNTGPAGAVQGTYLLAAGSSSPSAAHREGQSPSQNQSSGDYSGLGSTHLQHDGPSSGGLGWVRGQGQNQSSGGYRPGDLSELSALGLNIRHTPSCSSGMRGSRGLGQILRVDGQYEYDDEDAPGLPTASSTTSFHDHGVGRQAEECDNSITFSSVGGDHLSTVSDDKGALTSGSTTSDNLTSLGTDYGSLCHLGSYPSLRGPPAFPLIRAPLEVNPFKGFRYACLLCRQPMNTKEDYDRHMKGLKHQMKAATVSAPDRSKEPLAKLEVEADEEKMYEKAYKCCKTTPRTYQVELMRKSMASDSTVIYLPTGTGKTLAAMMTLSRMLTLNPTRPVLFLVDKVLLVLQQARYIINELGEPKTFRRPDLSEDAQLTERYLKVAVLCGGLSVRDATPLWKHDVIVTTAAFCQNLLQDCVLRWANFSLVVFDEAHHCTKNHPYNKLLSEHHLILAPERRPKVLGLTASPAGRPTKEETLHMLTSLLTNLGGAQIATVEEQIAKEQLDSFSSSARLVPICVPMTEAEMGFHERLLSYFIRTYVELMRCSNLQQICNSKALRALMTTSPSPVADDVTQFAQHLMNEPDELSEMVQLAQTARIKQGTVPPGRFENIRMHVMSVGMTLLNSEDGIDFVLDDLERLFNPAFNMFLPDLIELGLPCREIGSFVQTLCDSYKLRNSEGEGGRDVEGRGDGVPSTMSIFQELLVTLADEKYMSWRARDSMALVLVRERKVAHKFKDHLKQTSFVRERGMRVAVVVGHGAGSGEGEGMNLRKQDKVLQGIKSHRYNIVVATSVAEEGVDIPECQLVVCLNPPTTVKALVQMRGRARKKDSYFVVLCSSQREKEKLEDLQRQELNMKWAAQQLTHQNPPHQGLS